MHRGGIANLCYPTSETRRGRVIEHGRICPTITCEVELYRMNSEYELYRLTPLETWRLMDFTDEDYYKAASVNTQGKLYRQAGNSIVVNVLVAIFGQMLPGKEDFYKRKSFEENEDEK